MPFFVIMWTMRGPRTALIWRRFSTVIARSASPPSTNRQGRVSITTGIPLPGTTTEAADGNEALALFQPGSFDLVLTDWNMPGKTGLEVIQGIRAQVIDDMNEVRYATPVDDKKAPRGKAGLVDGKDGKAVHFAFDDNRHRAVVYSAKLPPTVGASPTSAARAATSSCAPGPT